MGKKKTDIVKPQDIQKFHLQLALKIVRLKDLKSGVSITLVTSGCLR